MKFLLVAIKYFMLNYQPRHRIKSHFSVDFIQEEYFSYLEATIKNTIKCELLQIWNVDFGLAFWQTSLFKKIIWFFFLFEIYIKLKNNEYKFINLNYWDRKIQVNFNISLTFKQVSYILFIFEWHIYI